ncbi:MAG TPA: isochorismatase family protein [Rhizomicrobium sp.]
MATLSDRPQTALLVVDVQAGVVARSHATGAVVANIKHVVEKARAGGVTVIWVRHANEWLKPGSDVWQIVPELSPALSEPMVEKIYPDAFEETVLEDILAELKVGRLVVTGLQTDECIRSTLHGALAKGYDATLVGDAHTTEDQTQWGAPPPDKMIAHTNLYWENHRAPGRKTRVVKAAELNFGA